MDFMGSETQLNDTTLNTAAREVFEHALIHIAQLHEQQVSELEEEIASLREQLAQRPRAKQTIISIDGPGDDSLEEVARWVRTEFNKTMTTPTKDSAGTSLNGLKGMPAEAELSRDELTESDSGIKDSDVTFSVAMAVAAEVQADRDEDNEHMKYESPPTPPAASSVVAPMSPSDDRFEPRATQVKRGRHLNSLLSKSVISEMSDMALTHGLERVGMSEDAYGYASEYLYRSPSEPRPEDNEEDLPTVLSSWVRIVEGLLKSAKEKKLYELRDPWVQPDWFLAKMMRQQENLDLYHPKNVRARHTSAARRTASRRTTRIIVEQIQTVRDTHRWNMEEIVLDPQSPKRIFWMSIGMFLMIYDLFVLPMQAFPLPNSWFLRLMQWFGQIFWTLDIGISFLTGVYINSEMVTRLSTIARVYATTWLVFDLLVVVPLWVVEFLGVNSGAAKSTAVFKYVRMLRFLRLARLAKFEHYLQEALATVNSSALLLCFGMFKQMSYLIVLNHINACLWYAVGKHGTGGWVEAYEDTPFIYRYLTSMHWAFTQFQGTSEITPTIGKGREVLERAHAVLTVMFALIILAFFVSRLTNMMLQLQQLREERTGMQRAVRAYLCANNISLQLSVRVKKYIDWKQNMQTKGRSSEVLEQLPRHLQQDLQEEVRSPLITTHSLFAAFKMTHLRFFRLLCFDGLKPLSPAPRELLFIPNDHAHQMYFIVTGTFRYFSSRLAMFAKHQVVEEVLNSDHHHDDIMVLGTGRWLSEPALWTKWDHRGGCMGINDSVLLTLSSTDFGRIAKLHGPAHASGVLYARQFVAGLNRFGKNYNDVLDSEALMHEMSDSRFSITESNSIR